MPLTHPSLGITGIGTPTLPATTEVRTLSAPERLRRAALAPALGVGVALIVLPIPIVHLFVPPLALIGGVAVGVRRLGQRELFVSVRGTCPCCGTEQSFGLSGARYRVPQELKCRSCLQLLQLDET